MIEVKQNLSTHSFHEKGWICFQNLLYETRHQEVLEMSDINKTISERNWPFSTLALTKIDDSWLNQHQHQHQHHNIYRLRYSNHPSNAIVEHPHQKDITSLKNELFDISRENCIFRDDLASDFGMSRPPISVSSGH